MLDPDLAFQSIGIDVLKGVGSKYVLKFRDLGLHNAFDLLFYLPFRYEDRTKLTPLKDLEDQKSALVSGTIVSSVIRGKVFTATIYDGTGSLDLVFFNFWESLTRTLSRGKRVCAFGTVRFNHFNSITAKTLPQPEFNVLNDGTEVKLEDHLSPIYHLTAKLPQNVVRRTVSQALERLEKFPLTELIPQALNPFKLTLSEAILKVHHPKAQEALKEPELTRRPEFQRLCFEEITAYQLSLLSLKKRNSKEAPLKVGFNVKIQEDLLAALPFTPTGAQQRVLQEILEDLGRSQPMMRLVQGDVGSGKTLVALMAAVQTVAAGGQCTIMAPTELLAKQHYKNASALLEKLGICCGYLSGRITAKARRELLAGLADGSIQVAVGTHAMVSEDVAFKNLALCIIDEQHRFGIDQRAKLLHKAPEGTSPHQLAMTATPIPRTLQLALYSDLDVSIIDELPPGRVPITTAVISDDRIADVIKRLQESCLNGSQAYWVCPKIEENGDDETASVKARFEELKKALPMLSVGLLHGALPAKEKDAVMQDFIDGKISILVATTVIEVGVDVPKASIMVIEDSHRLGLAQLHQLRGRVGRGDQKSFCLLLYSSASCTEVGAQRLRTMRATTDGFKIATEDLILRGPGDIVGQKQAGFDIFKIADVARDFALTDSARTCAQGILQSDPELSRRLIKRWFPQYL